MSAHAEEIPARARQLGIFGFIVLIIAATYQYQVQGIISLDLPTEPKNTIGTFYEVTRVTDGDTIHISMNGRDEKVRLIGINTPETVDPRTPVQCFGKEASKRMKELAEGEIVRLEYDETQSLRDVYDRILAYVYLEDGEMLNRKMIAEGYAYEYTYMTPYVYQKEFRDLQTLARTSERGLWSHDTCAGSKDIRQ